MTTRVTPVTGSSFIAGIGYDSESEELVVQFKDGASVAYSGVPEGVFHAFNDADSMGRYWHANIKDSYTSRRA